MNETMQMCLGGLLGVLSLSAVFFVIMGIYFALRKWLSGSKNGVEIAVVVFTYTLSVVVKFSIIVIGQPQTFWSGFSAILHAMYSGFGGLAFEGLYDLSQLGGSLIQCLYTGTSILAAFTFVSVITAKVNYEIYTRFSLLLQRIVTWMLGKSNVYIFTALTEDSLALACSIKNRDNQAKRKCQIAFVGSEIPPFNRRDELCRKVMANGFYYWTYTKSDERTIAKHALLNNGNAKRFNFRFMIFAFALDEKGIPKEEENMRAVLDDAEKRLNINDNLRIEYVILTKREINYQAYDYENRKLLASYVELHPNDEFSYDNGDNQIFCGRYKDENLRILNCEKKSKKHVLSGGKNKDTYSANENFITYLMMSERERLLSESEDSLVESFKGKQKLIYAEAVKSLNRQLSKRIVIDVWNEAVVGAHAAVNQFLENGEIVSVLQGRNNAKPISSADLAKQPQNPMEISAENKEVLVWSLGFGETSRAIVNELYTQTAYIDKNRQSVGFTVEAFDPRMQDVGGLYQYNHPLCACISGVDIKTLKEGDNRELLKKSRIKEISKMYKESLPEKSENQDAETMNIGEMTFPVFFLHRISTLDYSFLEAIDKVTGKEDYSTTSVRDKKSEATKQEPNATLSPLSDAKKFTPRPDVIVVAAGDDFRNIQLANALINDAQNEKRFGKDVNNPPTQTIIVNVRDKNNNALLISGGRVWQNNVLKLDGLTVIISGNSDILYSFENVVEHKEALYVFGYHCFDALGLKLTQEERDNYEKIKAACSLYLKDGEQSCALCNDERVSLQNGEMVDCKKFICDWVELTSRMLLEGKEEEIIPKIKEEIKKVEDLSDELATKAVKAVAKAIAERYIDRLGKDKDCTIEREWNLENLFRKESSRSAYSYGRVLYALFDRARIKENIGKEAPVLSWLCALEHHRWCRFHIINGWVYHSDRKNELLKTHNCIVPYCAVPASTVFYDLANVVWGVKSYFTKEQK